MKRSRLGIESGEFLTHAEAAPTRRFFSLFIKGGNKPFFSKIILVAMAFAIVLSTAYAPSVNASTASDAKQVLRAGWVAACVGPIFRGTDRTNMSIDDIQAFNSVLIGESIVGHVINQGDGRTSCSANSSQTLKENIATIGYSDILSLMRSLGCTQNSNGTSYSCPEMTDKQVYAKIAKDKNLPALTNAHKYYLALNTFTIGCKAGPTGATQGSADWEAAEASTNNLHKLQIVNNGQKVPTIYKAELDNDRNISTANPSIGWDDGSFNCSTLVSMVNTYAADYIMVNPNTPAEEVTGGGTTGSGSESGSSCSIEGIGWILCPVVNSLSSLADGAFSIISDSFLRTDTSVVANGGPTNQAWMIVRNIANIAFVIAFLIIIFSQLTGFGITNYGVKKMLPRLVIAAILVNASFIICQIAVDLSNILGYSINDVFRGISGEVLNLGTENTGVFNQGNLFSNIAVGILAFAAGAVAVYALLSAFLPVILAAVVALVMILFILIARQALIVLLIVLAPLAFVAFLLPNTEKLFKQWRKMFTALLLVFPIIALIFGGSQLASGVVKVSFSPTIVQTSNPEATEEEMNTNTETANNWFGQIISAAILVLPLFLVPTVLKKSLDGIPMVGQLASKWSNRTGSKVGGKLKESYRGSILGRGAAIRKQGRENYRSRRFAERISQDGKIGSLNQALAKGVPITKAEQAANAQLMKSATAATVKATREEVDDAKKLIENENLSGTERQALAMSGSVTTKNGRVLDGKTMQRAAIEMQLGGAGGYGQVEEIISASAKGKPLSGFSQVISQGALSAGSKDPTFGGVRIDEIAQQTFDYDAGTRAAIKDGKFNADALAGMHDSARAHAIKVAKEARDNGDSSYMDALSAAAATLETSSELRAKVAGNEKAQLQLAELKQYATASTTAAQASSATAQPQTVIAPAAPAEGPTVTRVSTRQQPDASALDIPHNTPTQTPPQPPTPPQQPPTQPPTTP